jgi:hypothetical protein
MLSYMVMFDIVTLSWYYRLMKKILAASVAALALSALLIPAAAHADNPENGCPFNITFPKCTTIESNNYPNTYYYVPGAAAHNAPVLTAALGDQGHEDFDLIAVRGLFYQIEYAPKGVNSGYCLSAPNRGKPIVLRVCAVGGNQWQSFDLDSTSNWSPPPVHQGYVILSVAQYSPSFQMFSSGLNQPVVYAQASGDLGDNPVWSFVSFNGVLSSS